MSRALNLSLSEADVRSQCKAGRLSISALELLPDGGTRVVLTTSEEAHDARHRFRKSIIEGRVRRLAFQWVPSR